MACTLWCGRHSIIELIHIPNLSLSLAQFIVVVPEKTSGRVPRPCQVRWLRLAVLVAETSFLSSGRDALHVHHHLKRLRLQPVELPQALDGDTIPMVSRLGI